MTAADVAALAGEVIGDLTPQAAVLADRLDRIAKAVTSMECVVNVAVAAREEGLAAGRAEHDAYAATASAQRARAAFQVLPGGRAVRMHRAARRVGAQ